jgi:hypothetical protein
MLMGMGYRPVVTAARSATAGVSRDQPARRPDVDRDIRRRRAPLDAREDEAGYINYEAFTAR